MSHTLTKPYNDKERADFIVKYNHNQGMLIEETKTALYALEADEIMKNGVPVKNPDYFKMHFQKMKEMKQEENLKKAFEAEEKGVITYKDALFETSSSNIAKINAKASMLQQGLIDKIQWLSKDDKQFEFTLDDVIEIARAIDTYTSSLWNNKYLTFKQQIENALSIEELKSIEITY